MHKRSKNLKFDRLTIERALKESTKTSEVSGALMEGTVGFLHYAAEASAQDEQERQEFTSRVIGWQNEDDLDSVGNGEKKKRMSVRKTEAKEKMEYTKQCRL